MRSLINKIKNLSNIQIIIIGLVASALILTVVLTSYGVSLDRQALKKAQSAGSDDLSLEFYSTVTNKWAPPTTNSLSESVPTTLKDPAGTPVITTAPAAGENANLESAASWSRSEILTRVTNAINNTKNYRGSLNVHHQEGFTANITECSGGSLVQTVAQTMMGWVVKPVDETLSYVNGTAVNSDGETVVIILPKRGPFCLTSSGISSASAYTANGEYVVKLKIVKESVGTYDVPPHNAASIGYLDVSSMDLSLLKINSAKIDYIGSTLEIHFNADNRVTYAEYHIPLHVYGEGSGLGISGSMVFDGEQTEYWDFNW